MRFEYEYRTSDNVPHCGTLSAATRDAAYAVLRARGIRPSAVREAPGVWNKVFGRGKRWLLIVVLLAIVGVLTAMLLRTRGIGGDDRFADRAQVYGDPWALRHVGANGWAEVFESEGDRYLARHAVPGVECGCGSARADTKLADILVRELSVYAVPRTDELVEVAQVKRMVNGMKREIAKYLSDGGTIAKYMQRLEIRQRAEMGIVREARRTLKSTQDAAEWRKTNLKLRSMGLPMVEEDLP